MGRDEDLFNSSVLIQLCVLFKTKTKSLFKVLKINLNFKISQCFQDMQVLLWPSIEKD